MLSEQSKLSHEWYVENGRKAGYAGKGCKHNRDHVEAVINARKAAMARWSKAKAVAGTISWAVALAVMAYIAAVVMFCC